jgi:ribosomal protein S27E
MKLNCLSCGHWMDLRDAYDDYEGQVKCYICGALLFVRTCEGQVKAVEMAGNPRPVRSPAVGQT